MDLNLIFWAYAYLLTCLALFTAVLGVKKARLGDYPGHYKYMVTACNLILFFVLSYVFKVLFLHREDKSNWKQLYLVVLYIHESLILLMLVFGTRARLLARKLKEEARSGKMNPANAGIRRQHTKAGKLTMLFCCLALATASVVLYGMIQRA